MEKKLYIAYGSNLNVKGMRSRCPDANPIGYIYLDNARLVFRGVADVELEPGSICPAGLWEISEKDEEKLDLYEGVRHGLYARYHIPLRGRKQKGLIYLMRDRGIFPPSQWYASTIRDGYRNFKLNQSFLDEAIKHSFDKKAPSEQTRSRRRRQLASWQYKLVKIPESVALERQERELLDRQRTRRYENSNSTLETDQP